MRINNKIIHKDPQDLMTLNTIGDLQARAGQTEERSSAWAELNKLKL